jgi:hypothetical protein
MKHGYGWEAKGAVFYKGEFSKDLADGYALIRDGNGKEKFAKFGKGVMEDLSVNVPKKLFEYFEGIEMDDFLERSEKEMERFDRFLWEEGKEVERGVFDFKGEIESEGKKLNGVLKQISVNVENMEISFEKIMGILELDLQKANIDMRKLMRSYNYDLQKEKEEHTGITMDANRSLHQISKNPLINEKTNKIKNFNSNEVAQNQQNFDKVLDQSRRARLLQIQADLEKIFAEKFENFENSPKKYLRNTARQMTDKKEGTDKDKGLEKSINKEIAELRETRQLLKIEKTDLKKQKEELLMLIKELESKRSEQGEQNESYVFKGKNEKNFEIEQSDVIESISEFSEVAEARGEVEEVEREEDWLDREYGVFRLLGKLKGKFDFGVKSLGVGVKVHVVNRRRFVVGDQNGNLAVYRMEGQEVEMMGLSKFGKGFFWFFFKGLF